MTAKSRPVPPKSSAPSIIVSQPLLAQAGNASAEGTVNIFIFFIINSASRLTA